MMRGDALPLEQCWRLAQAWYGAPRSAPEWRRRTPQETRDLFAALGLTSDFWSL